MSDLKLGDPGVVGLGGFALTTIMLQFHNLGWVAVGPVLWIGFLYGGTAQLIAGLLEFKTGNNFGFCAFTGYGAFWISLCFFLVFGTNAELVKAYPVLKFTAQGLGFFLLGWTIFTAILFMASLKHHTGLILTFLTLFLGFAGLTVKELFGNAAIGTLAAYDLIICALLAWYLMAVPVFAEVGINLPVGKPWIK